MKNEKKYSGIGGQAVMEGIMMRNNDKYSIAVRKPDGTIEVTVDDYKSVAGNAKLAKMPFVRGVFAFVDSICLGYKALSWSASFYDDDPDEVKVEKESDLSAFEVSDEEAKAKADKKTEDKVNGEETGLMMGIAVVISLVFSIGLFMLIPYFVTEFLRKIISSNTILAVLEGLIRLVIFISYVALISLMKDIKRVYMYHGAEHKCINCIERGYVLNVKNVMKASRQHSRCGTSFLLFVMFVSIVLFLFIRTSNPLMRVVVRILLIPVISGISYEIIRIAGKSDNIIVRAISAPGMWLQKITTREPDEDMVEVAIKAVEAVFDWKQYFKDTFGVDVDEQPIEEEENA